MAENIFRLKRIAKKDPYVTPNTAVEKHIYDSVHEDGGSGGGGYLVVKITGSDGEYEMDKEYSELVEAYKKGQLIIGKYMGSCFHLFPEAVYEYPDGIEISGFEGSVTWAKYGNTALEVIGASYVLIYTDLDVVYIGVDTATHNFYD